MAEVQETKSKPAAEPAPVDLSSAIDRAMVKQPDEEVKTVRLFGNCYRCNFWVPDKNNNQMTIKTGTIRRSNFLKVTMSANQLVIEDLSR